MKITESYESLPKILKLILQFFFGWIISSAYRIIKFFETKNIVTLIVGIICIPTGALFGIVWIIDFVTEILHNRITVLAA